ncbi:hypothetical protein MNEG_9228 [Monoraphidium neglectum]|uniref:NmrA-like domain-containing protein n=1 Tax=Monoraphidium neglectum TaxID=145388 RepID=A0A0D2KTD5_9CHLO|nr:hypothetical protein MNEG_9228 [Monoraphidium neglectum]KIY98733.1 hypothetical protein MNEG_9228 [Monoraphidium neglectum]|eukprot:XP_013897753.1 hypothetical protein MNEG_9228 [Monoraphidium neglectum]
METALQRRGMSLKTARGSARLCHARVRTVVRAQKTGPRGTFKLTKGGASAQQAAAPALDLFGTLTRSLSRGAKSPVSGGGARDPGTVFVAGATGKLGIRIVRELLDAGFKVRAGARDVEKAEANAAIAAQLGLVDPGEQARP